MTRDELILKVAKAIAAAWDVPWRNIPDDKSHLHQMAREAEPAMRDVNMPFKRDYLIMAEYAIAEIARLRMDADDLIGKTL